MYEIVPKHIPMKQAIKDNKKHIHIWYMLIDTESTHFPWAFHYSFEVQKTKLSCIIQAEINHFSIKTFFTMFLIKDNKWNSRNAFLVKDEN